MAQPYYILATREDNGRWYPQFGSYVRAEITAERQEYRRTYAAKALLVLAVLDASQKGIEEAFQRLNNPLPLMLQPKEVLKTLTPAQYEALEWANHFQNSGTPRPTRKVSDSALAAAFAWEQSSLDKRSPSHG